jgi:hypothetical protein
MFDMKKPTCIAAILLMTFVTTSCVTSKAYESVKIVIPADAGLNTPECAIHDEKADIYIVSNINGNPLGKDKAGFISRVAPSGEILELKWIDGGSDGVTLNAPKGLAIVGDTLYAADVNAIRKFHRVSGKPVGVIEIKGSSFLNDLASGPDGKVYVSDSGFGGVKDAPRTDAVYEISPDGSVAALSRGEEVPNPNGLLVTPGGLLVCTWNSGELLWARAREGRERLVAKLPKNQLDGIVVDKDGSLLITSWAGECVYRFSFPKGSRVAIEGLKEPADPGWDAKRGRLLIPHFKQHQLTIITP